MDSFPVILNLAPGSVESIKALIPKSNDWQPVFTALGGAVVGGLISIIPTWLNENRKRQLEAEAVKTALITEVSALLDIIVRREYLDRLDEMLINLHCRGKNGTLTFSIRIQNHYSRVYQSLLDKIGLLDKGLAKNVISFHQLLDSLIQDITPGGLIADEGGTFNNFIQLKQILVLALNEATCILGEQYMKEKFPEGSASHKFLSSGIFGTPTLAIFKQLTHEESEASTAETLDALNKRLKAI